MTLEVGVELNVTHARWLSGCLLEITFSDGLVRTVDFEPFLVAAVHPEIRKYLDIELFKGFSISFGNLVWNDYDLCFSVGDLYSGCLIVHEAFDSMVAEDAAEYRENDSSRSG